MANVTWIGGTTAVAQVITITLGGTWETNDKLKVTLYDEAGAPLQKSYAAGSTAIATICTSLAASLNLETDSRFAAVTWAAGATTVTGTADTAGVPIFCSVVSTESDDSPQDSQTMVVAVTTANAGPNSWHTAANWTGGAVPGSSDSVYIDNTSTEEILYGLYQNTALTTNNSVTLALLKIRQGHPQVGTLAAPLTYKTTAFDYGEKPADGSNPSSAQICNLAPGNVTVTGYIRGTNTTGSGGKPPLQINVGNSSAVYTVTGTSYVGFGTAVDGETVTVGTITVKDGANVTIGSGVTLTTLNPEGGKTTMYGGATTINYGVGAVNVYGAGSITTVSAGGAFEWDSSGTITTYNGSGASVGKFWRGTVTNANLYGAQAYIDASVSGIALNCTFTNGVDCIDGARTSQVNYGDSVNVTPAAP